MNSIAAVIVISIQLEHSVTSWLLGAKQGRKRIVLWNKRIRAYIAPRCREGVLTMQKFIFASLANLCRKRLPYQQRELYYALVLLDTRDYHSNIRTISLLKWVRKFDILTRCTIIYLRSFSVSIGLRSYVIHKLYIKITWHSFLINKFHFYQIKFNFNNQSLFLNRFFLRKNYYEFINC